MIRSVGTSGSWEKCLETEILILFFSAIVNVVNHLIWEMKLRKELQPVSVFYEDVKYAVHKLLKGSEAE
jgi:hypothetical protein